MVKEKEEALETTDERRSFDYTIEGVVTKFYLGMPTSEQIRKAEWHYSKVYNKALVEGVATTSEMMDILTKRGIYGPEYEETLRDLQVKIAVSLAEMQNADDEAVKEEKARVVQDLRDQLYRWNQRLTGPLSNSCEQMAEDAKTEYITSAVVQNEDSSSFWPAYEDFIAEDNQGLALKARFEVMLWLQGLDTDFLEKTPEQVVLQEISLKRVEAEAAAAEAVKEEPAQLLPAETAEPTTKPTPKRRRTSKAKKTAK